MGRSREELERIVRPRLGPSRMGVRVHPPMLQCLEQEALLIAFLSPKQPLSAQALEPPVSAAVVNYEGLPFPLRLLLGKLCLHWLGQHGAECHAFIALDALTCSGCDMHNRPIYVLLLRLLPILRRTLLATDANPVRASR